MHALPNILGTRVLETCLAWFSIFNFQRTPGMSTFEVLCPKIFVVQYRHIMKIEVLTLLSDRIGNLVGNITKTFNQ